MKKIALFLMSALVLISFAACGGSGRSSSSEILSPDIPSSDISSSVSSEADVPDEESADEEDVLLETMPITEPITPAGASEYRGEVSAISDDGTVITLSQVEGTVFGPASIKVNVTADTKTNFPLAKLQPGAYLGVFYGGEASESVDAIVINYLADKPEYCVTNGEVVSVIVNDRDSKQGQILVKDLSTGEEVAFNYTDDGTTRMRLDLGDVKVGDKLSFYHGFAATSSLPPQIFALEISPYASL